MVPGSSVGEPLLVLGWFLFGPCGTETSGHRGQLVVFSGAPALTLYSMPCLMEEAMHRSLDFGESVVGEPVYRGIVYLR